MPFIGNKPTAVPLSADDLEDNIISTAKIQDNAVTPAKYIEPVPFRNIIINGDMSIAQRGTSQASISSTGYYTVDRWNFVNSNLGTFTMSQDTDVPTGQGFAKSLKVDCTTADAAPAGADYLFLQTKFEGQNLQYIKKGTANAESLTLSFWVKSSKTGTYIAELFDVDNTRAISKSYTINSASTWEKKTITFAGDTSGTLVNDNSSSLELHFWLGAGSDRTSGTLQTSWGTMVQANRVVGSVNFADSTSNDFWITGVQLEAGTTASDFEFLPYDVNLRRCLRYLPSIQVKTYHVGGICYSSTDARETLKFPVKARTAPTGISYDGTIKFTDSGGSPKGTGVAFNMATEDNITILSVGASGLTAGYSTSLATDSSNTRTILCTGSEL
jgi:hypothetical protein